MVYPVPETEPCYALKNSPVTTSKALSWAFYHLARDQQLQQIVADEVKDLPEEVSPQHLAPWIPWSCASCAVPLDVVLD